MMLDTRMRILLTVFVQLTVLVFIECWIVRLQCIDQEGFNKFNIKHNGYALENNVLAVYERMDLEECKTMCLDEYRCRSINYSEGKKQCELNDKIKETSKSGDFKAKIGYTYLATNYATKNIGPVCQALRPCTNATYCIDKCSAPGYNCVTCPKYHEMRYEQYCQLKEFVNRFYELRNIAIGKATFQSSVHYYHIFLLGNYYYASNFANDGDVKCLTFFNQVKFASTLRQANPYWRVDLESSAVVLNVSVKNRDDSNGNLISPFDIRVGNTVTNGYRDNPFCVTGATLKGSGEMKNFTCPENEGRYVSIHLTRTQYLQLCEVEVYGIYL